MSKPEPTIPFEALPVDPAGPPGNAWGRFGAADQLGTLNLLTPEVIVAAAKEIRTGVRISLDWPLSMPTYPSFERDPFHQRIVHRRPNCINDDILTFNTQGSTQWDGFRHYAHQQSKRFYNGHTQEEIEGTDVLGLHVVTEAGGITGRGILLDYASWADEHDIPLAPLTSSAIPVAHLTRLLADHGVQPRPADILFIRSGFTRAYHALSDAERHALARRPAPDFIGLEASEAAVRWLWAHQFAAVAGDAPSFERAPIRGAHADPRFNLHEWVLAGWGCPIGELFDLERLAEHCRETRRYEFFLASVPLKVVGGVATPPNSVAIF
ncbi:uncharacterized protein BO95DRAFT_513721 [Aspergillus brunneoviolaceus CBS 621.78]|uniref:Uncharacterized protein n=1 Tax=Aspergillus brunneoviolaceus CBS 621.78 TaxID=1450534 RepID=A0ACD1GBR6_9EURO|nr:hypothetical protein BO95DRAFT_513721 [Aspergillus brunneoviolaceus CBS 621.78]RAH46739.1 hypothetical protein BO95DRAFT_513721 [Aspergillus brunneoviolaceus CBS 621.78]